MDVLEELIKNRDKVAERIRDLIAERDAIGGQISVYQDELKELNDEIDYTRTEEEHDRVAKEAEFEEVLKSDDYSLLAREYRRLNKELCEGRKRGWYTFMENTAYPSEGELRQQRRDVGDRMLGLERCA